MTPPTRCSRAGGMTLARHPKRRGDEGRGAELAVAAAHLLFVAGPRLS